MTHEQNQYISDQQRIALANRAQNQIFVSLHLNEGRSDYHGIETYSLFPTVSLNATRPGNAHDAMNTALAFSLHSALLASTGAQDGACRRARYSLLSSISCPAALVELGYATHKDEGASLSSDEYQAKLASALANGIDHFTRVMDPETILQPTPSAEIDTPPTTYTAAQPVPVVEKPTPARKNNNTRNNTRTRKNTSKPKQNGNRRRRR